MAAPGSDEPLVLDLPPEASVVGVARRAAMDVLERWGHAELADDVGTVLSELVTNAVLHAGTDIELTLRRVGDGVRIEVTDRAPDLLPRESVQAPIDWFAEVDADWDPLDAESMTGRGLLVVGQLAEGWGVDLGDGTKTVWSELGTGRVAAHAPLPPPPEPAAVEGGVPLRFLGVPVRLILSSAANLSDVNRELTVRGVVDDEVGRLAAALGGRGQPPRGAMVDAAAGAVERRDRLVDVSSTGSPEGAVALREIFTAMDHVADLCRRGELLAAPPSDEVVAFRHWFVLETERQVGGWEPSPCPFPASAADDPAVVEASRQARARLAARSPDAAKLLTRLSQTSAALVVSADLQEALDLAAVAAADELGSTTAALYVLEADGVGVAMAVTTRERDEITERWQHFRVADDLPVAEVLRTRSPLFMGTLREMEAQFPDVVGQPAGSSGAIAFLPVGADAALVFGFPDERLFDEVDRAFLGALASVAAQAVTRLRAETLSQANVETEARFRTMADAAPVLIWKADTTGGCDWFNQGWLEFRGRTLEDEVDDGWEAGIHPDDLDQLRQVYFEAFAQRAPYVHDYRLLRADGTYRWIFDRGVPRFLPDGSFAGYVGSCVDIDDRKAAEAEARRAHEQLAFLTTVSDAVAARLDAVEVLGVVVAHAVPRLADLAFAFLAVGGELERVAFAAGDHEGFDAWLDERAVPLDGDTPVNVAFLTGEVVRTTFDDASLASASPAVRAAIRSAGLRRGVVVPFSSPRGERLGVLGFSVTDDARPHSLDDLALVGELAARAGVAVENALLYQWQHTLAEQLQQAVLPDVLPEVAGVVVDACYRPASMGAEVGGDWYDAFTLRDGRVGLAVGDVSGHGLHAASAMGRLRNALRAYALAGDEPAAVLDRLCDFHDASEVFATLVYAVLDPETGELRWANAGHLTPFLRREGTVTVLEGPVGPPIGVDATIRYAETAVRLAAGDVVLICTDGLVERRGEDLDVGMGELAAALVAGGPIEGLSEAVVRAVLGPRENDDDVCVLAVERRSGG
ncbi:MAG: hypothetical protein JWO68_356 [Actinomycetia bacterium]|nr:hypothetical protein [Actinomycetes bacterium]